MRSAILAALKSIITYFLGITNYSTKKNFYSPVKIWLGQYIYLQEQINRLDYGTEQYKEPD